MIGSTFRGDLERTSLKNNLPPAVVSSGMEENPYKAPTGDDSRGPVRPVAKLGLGPTLFLLLFLVVAIVNIKRPWVPMALFFAVPLYYAFRRPRG